MRKTALISGALVLLGAAAGCLRAEESSAVSAGSSGSGLIATSTPSAAAVVAQSATAESAVVAQSATAEPAVVATSTPPASSTLVQIGNTGEGAEVRESYALPLAEAIGVEIDPSSGEILENNAEAATDPNLAAQIDADGAAAVVAADAAALAAANGASNLSAPAVIGDPNALAENGTQATTGSIFGRRAAGDTTGSIFGRPVTNTTGSIFGRPIEQPSAAPVDPNAAAAANTTPQTATAQQPAGTVIIPRNTNTAGTGGTTGAIFGNPTGSTPGTGGTSGQTFNNNNANAPQQR